MTKICITASGPDLDSAIDPRFGRCAYFVIVDTETMESEAISNEAIMASGGAGIRAAQTVASKGVQKVITGSVGPNAYSALSSSGIEIMTGASGTVKSAIEDLKQGSLTKITASGPAYAGMPGGMGGGRGMGRRGGRGRRGGQGRRDRW